jgi:hypothetical protein
MLFSALKMLVVVAGFIAAGSFFLVQAANRPLEREYRGPPDQRALFIRTLVGLKARREFYSERGQRLIDRRAGWARTGWIAWFIAVALVILASLTHTPL